MKTMEEAKLKVVRLADNVITTSGGIGGGECVKSWFAEECQYQYEAPSMCGTTAENNGKCEFSYSG